MKTITNFDNISRPKINFDELFFTEVRRFFITVDPPTVEDDLQQIIRLFELSPDTSLMDSKTIESVRITLFRVQKFFNNMGAIYDIFHPEALKYPVTTILEGKRILETINLVTIEDDLDLVMSMLSNNPGTSNMSPVEVENLRFTIRQIQKYFQKINPDFTIQVQPSVTKEEMVENAKLLLHPIERIIKGKKLEKIIEAFAQHPNASLMDIQNLENLLFTIHRNQQIVLKMIDIHEQG